MKQHWLKFLRAAVGLAVFLGLGAALADFRGSVPGTVSHVLGSLQLVPSFMALAAGASLAAAGLLVLVVTLLAGRIYCSAICPLGVLQDVTARVARWLPGKRKRLAFSRGYPWVRYLFFWACVAGIVSGWAAFALSLLDPYSVFGRMTSGLFRPVVTELNNLLVRPANAAGLDALYRVDAQWAGVGALALPLGMLLLVVILSAWRGRLYCNTVCPVGTLLGFLSARSAFRLGIDKQACRKCANCLRVCKAQCIDLRAGAIDSSRCVACFNCVSACPEQSIGYRLEWKSRPGSPAEAKPVAACVAEAGAVANPPRRLFLAGGVAFLGVMGGWSWLGKKPSACPPPRTSRAVSPPGSAGVERFLNRCTACQLCISACPTHVLQPSFMEYGLAGLMKPRLDYQHSFCNFECTECGQVCPEGAILPLALADKQLTRVGVASLDLERCVVPNKGSDCAACSEHCPTKAVHTVPYRDNLRLPEVDESLCIGCGACEYACPVQPEKAITVAGLGLHERAQKCVEQKAQKPKLNGDFPF